MNHSDALNKYEELLVQLHKEMRAGRADGQKADEIRDQMDIPWYDLTEFEQASIKDASGDLYLIEEGSSKRHLDIGETHESNRKCLIIALKENDSAKALCFFRRLEKLEAIHYYIIGRCWEQLGFSVIAKCFYEFVYEYEFNLDRFFNELAVKEVHDL